MVVDLLRRPLPLIDEDCFRASKGSLISGNILLSSGEEGRVTSTKSTRRRNMYHDLVKRAS